MLGSTSFISFNSHSNTNHIKCNYFALILIQNGDEFRIDNNPKSKFRKVFILQQSSVYALAICRFDDLYTVLNEPTMSKIMDNGT